MNLAVVAFVYFGISISVFIITLVLFLMKKTKTQYTELEFKLPNCWWFLLYFLFLAFVFLLGLNDLINLGVWVVVLFVIILFISNCAMFCTGESRAMFKTSNVQGGAEYAKEVRDTAPVLRYHVECSHIAKKDTKLTTYDEDGKEVRVETKKEGEKVVTYTLNYHVPIPYWGDFTDTLCIPGGQLLVHVITKEHIEWMDNSAEFVEYFRKRLYNQNCHRDKDCEATTYQGIPNLTHDRMIRNGPSSEVPCLLNCCIHILWILLGLGLPFAVYVASVASVVRFHATKRASFFHPIVTPEWCREHNIDYLRILPTADVVRDSASFHLSNGIGQHTQPCLQNPLPLVSEMPSVNTAERGSGSTAPPSSQAVAAASSSTSAHPQPPQPAAAYYPPPPAGSGGYYPSPSSAPAAVAGQNANYVPPPGASYPLPPPAGPGGYYPPPAAPGNPPVVGLAGGYPTASDSSSDSSAMEEVPAEAESGEQEGSKI